MEEPESFEYPDSPGAPFVSWWEKWESAPDGEREGIAPAARDDAPEASARRPEDEAVRKDRQADELRQALAAARVQGIEEGRRLERERSAAAGAAAESQRAQQMAARMEKFAAECDRYLHQVEEEVVRLALAIAARILRREAQSDPLLLLGAVRVALGQVAACSELRLRVPAADLDLWTAALALLPNQNVKPALVAGEGMRLGDCSIETSLGNADLSVRAQLGEIERSILDAASGAGAATEVLRPGPGETAR